MKKALAFVAVLGLAATMAFASPTDRSNTPIYSHGNGVTITATPLGSPIEVAGGNNTYSSMGPSLGFIFWDTGTGTLLADDYTSNQLPATGTHLINEYGFVGGVAAAGQVMFFTFFDSNSSFVDSFGVQFSSGGNYIYTITLGTPQTVANKGFNQWWVDDGSVLVPSTGAVFATTTGAITVGSNVPTSVALTSGGVTTTTLPFVASFRLDMVPEPATLGLLAAGLVCLVARRRG